MEKIKESKKNKVTSEKRFEQRNNLSRLYLCFVIVNAGLSDSIIKLMQNIGCSACFIQNGQGTANETLRNILNIVEVKKEVIMGVMRESHLDELDKEITAFFAAAKRNKGISFAIPLSAIAGIKAYKFLSQTI